jgi:hypothetical protein
MIERSLAPDSLAVALFNDSRFTALESKVAHSAISSAAPDNQRGSNTMCAAAVIRVSNEGLELCVLGAMSKRFGSPHFKVSRLRPAAAGLRRGKRPREIVL